jgi:DNA-binding XRE family transcriptional regulator
VNRRSARPGPERSSARIPSSDPGAAPSARLDEHVAQRGRPDPGGRLADRRGNRLGLGRLEDARIFAGEDQGGGLPGLGRAGGRNIGGGEVADDDLRVLPAGSGGDGDGQVGAAGPSGFDPGSQPRDCPGGEKRVMFLAGPPGTGGAELCAWRRGPLKKLRARGRQPRVARWMMNAAELPEQVRASSGLTQEELARRAGTSRPTLSAYEHGRRSPTVATFARLLSRAGWELAALPQVSFTQRQRHGRTFRGGTVRGGSWCGSAKP